LVLIFTVMVPAQAQTPDPPQAEHTAPYWNVAYWNNVSLTGDPTVTTTDASLNHEWGTRSPHPGINPDQFSARWTRYIDVAGGRYRFSAVSDDGIRIYVDDELILDEWYDHPWQRFMKDVTLSPGHHQIKVEYYENQGQAVVRVTWEPAPTNSDVWHGEYYDNRWFNGTPRLRDDDAINFNWHYAAPMPGIPGDGYSVRWTRTVALDAGTYRFTASSDDGIRVYLQPLNQSLTDIPVINDAWYDHPTRTFTGEVYMQAGEYRIVVEYYENTGLATAKVAWQPVPASSDTWRATYYANPRVGAGCRPPVTSTDCRAIVRDDPEINFDWGWDAPIPEMPQDRFSVRWTRMAYFEPGSYRFTTATDDGVRLWVDNHLLIDNWRDQALTSHSGTMYLEGDVPLKMEYYENSGVAAARLTWERVDGNSPDPSPDGIIVDDTDPGFVKGGPASTWSTANEGYGGHLTWARNKNWFVRYQWPGYNWGRWYPNIAAGRYEVFVYIPDRYTTSTEARYWIKHSGGYTSRIVNQSANGNRWVSLGTYGFNGDGEDRVSLATPTHEADRSSLLAFDAVKWVRR
jgi:hypothetical protein